MAFFVADAVITAHGFDEGLVGVPVFIGMMVLWASSAMSLDESVAKRRARRTAERHHAPEQREG